MAGWRVSVTWFDPISPEALFSQQDYKLQTVQNCYVLVVRPRANALISNKACVCVLCRNMPFDDGKIGNYYYKAGQLHNGLVSRRWGTIEEAGLVPSET